LITKSIPNIILIKYQIEYIIPAKGKKDQLEDSPSPLFSVISNPLTINKYWQEDSSSESEQLVLGPAPKSMPLGSPPYQPLPSRSTSPVSEGTPHKYTTVVMI
jgi:hypothetical protein